MNLLERIDVYEGFPKEGISFKDINSLIRDPQAYREAVNALKDLAEPLKPDLIVAPESRGYIFGCPLAYAMDVGMVPVRKPGKLPGECIQESYELEYSTDTLEMQKNAIQPGQRVVIVDDLLATGGTMEAIIRLVESLGGIVAGILVVIELTDLKGKEKIKDYYFSNLIEFDH